MLLDMLHQGGTYIWLLIFIGIIILFLAIKKGIDLFSGKEIPAVRMEAGINAIMFWGSIAAVLGVFIHFMGVFEAMIAINQANDISPAIVAMGYAMSLISILLGIMLFMVAAVIWFIYRWRFKSLRSKLT